MASIPKGKRKIWILRTMDDNSPVETTNSQQIQTYTTKEAIGDFLEKSVLADGERLKCLNGDNILSGWLKNVGIDSIVKFNKHMRDNDIISDVVSSKGSLKNQINEWGDEWIDSISSKPTEYHLIDKKYADHGAQIFLKNNKVFLLDLSKPIVIEIKNEEMTKMFKSFFEIIKDNTKNVGISELLRNMK